MFGVVLHLNELGEICFHGGEGCVAVGHAVLAEQIVDVLAHVERDVAIVVVNDVHAQTPLHDSHHFGGEVLVEVGEESIARLDTVGGDGEIVHINNDDDYDFSLF